MANYSTDSDLRTLEDIDNWRPRTRLTAGVSAAALSLSVDTVDGFPDVCTLAIESEHVSVTARDLSNNTFTITRGADSTTAAIHSDNSVVSLASFDWIYAEAKRQIDWALLQRGIDAGYDYDLPRIYDISELKTASNYLSASLLCRRQNTRKDDTYVDKSSWYLKKYHESVGDLRPRVIDINKTAAVWHNDGGTWIDRTTDANVIEGAPFDFLTSSSDYFYWGWYLRFSNVNCLFATAGSYSGIVWEYWNGSAWTALTVTDSTASFTNITSVNTVGFPAPGDWTPSIISGAVDGKSRYWVRVSASTVTTAARAWYCGQFIVSPYRIQAMMDGSIDLSA